MKRFHAWAPVLLPCCILSLLLFLYGCEKKHSPVENPPPDARPEYIGFSGDTCLGPGMARPEGRDAFLEGHAFSGDTLSFVFRYPANCCPGFLDSTRVSENGIEILMIDTLNGCRCICSYRSIFRFIYRGCDSLRVQFRLGAFDWKRAETVVDTSVRVCAGGSS